MALIQININVSGRVQGVGYRYACSQAAKRINILGWVQNQPNGSVEIMAQGTETDITDFINWAKQGPNYANVTEIKTETVEPLSEFNDFSIL